MAKDIKVRVTGDTSDLNESLDKAKRKTEDLGKTNVDGLRGSFERVKLASVAIGAAIGTALVKIKDYIVESIRLYNQQMKVETQLAAVLKSTGYAAGLSAKELKNMASGLQSVTTFGDETIIGAENLLLTFTKIGKDVFPQALETVLDMSTAMGTDLKGSAIQLGKALNDPITGISALREVGVSFTEQQIAQVKALVASGKTLEAQKIIIRELQTEFGGSARAQAANLEGSFTQLKNSWGDFRENLVRGWAADLSIMASNMNAFVGWLNKKLNESQIAAATNNIKYYKRLYDLALDDYQRDYAYSMLKKTQQQMNELVGDSSIPDFNKGKGNTPNSDISKGNPEADKYKEAQASMSEYFERLGEYQNAAIAKEYESYQAFLETKQGQNVLLEDNAALEEEYANRKLLAEVAGAQQEVALKEQVIRAKLGLESTAFQGAQMFANAGATLMSSQNKKLFKLGQVASIANVWMNTAQAITKGYAQLGAFGGTAFATLMGVVGGVQTQNIMKQKPPGDLKNESSSLSAPELPKYNVVPLAQGVFDVPRDMPAVIHQGESVMPKSWAESVRDGEMGSMGTTIIVQGNLIDTEGLLQAVHKANSDIARRTGTTIYSR